MDGLLTSTLKGFKPNLAKPVSKCQPFYGFRIKN